MNNNTVSTKFISILTFSLIGLFFFQKLISSLVVGGRWDLNEHIAFADRIAEGVIKYSNGVTDLFIPSSPYFPGVGYLSYIYQQLGIEDTFLNNQLLLVTAVLVGLIYFILLNKLTIKLYPNISTVMIYFISTMFLLTHFRAYIGYMVEFKPDTILLLIGMLILFLIEKNKKISVLDIFLISFLLFPDFVDFLIKKVRIPIIKSLRLFLSHFWVTHVIIVHVCKKKNKLKWLNKCPNFRKN